MDLFFSIRLLPLCSHGCHGVNAHEHRGDGEPVLKPAEFLTKIPDIVTGIDKIEDGVESGHQQVRKSQVNDEVIGSGPHSPVCQNNPDDGGIAHDGCDNDEGVGDGPQSNPPSRLGELGCRRPVAAVLEGVSLRNVAGVKDRKHTHGFSFLVSVKENLLASAHFLAVDAGGMNFHAFNQVLLKRHQDELSHVFSSCFPSDAMQFQEEMSDAKSLLLLAWHFNLHLKSKN